VAASKKLHLQVLIILCYHKDVIHNSNISFYYPVFLNISINSERRLRIFPKM